MLKIFEISVEKYLKKIFFGQNTAHFKNDDFESFLYTVKNG